MDNERIEAIEESVCALAYYMYRQAGCPQGDTLQQFNLWVSIQREHWKNFVLPTVLELVENQNNKE